jgi:hypothetical protein
MKLTNETQNVLKNFATINGGLKFKVGSVLETISQSNTVRARAVVDNHFEQTFCVHDMNNFLSVHSLFKETEIGFDGSDIIFTGGRSTIRYRMTEEDQIVVPEDGSIVIEEPDAEFTLSKEDYDTIIKTAYVLKSPNIAIQSDGNVVNFVTYSAEDNSTNVNSTEVAEGNGKVYKIVFKTDNFKMISGGYDIQVSFDGFVHFKNVNGNIEYWLASEIDHNSIEG